MPTQQQSFGVGILAVPGRRYAAPQRNSDGGTENSSRPIHAVELGRPNGNVSGTTVNSSLVFIPFCTVDLFNSVTNQWIARTTSDAAGLFSFVAPGAYPFFIRAVDSTGTPVGTTINGLSASA
jgi:hypothetical protein